MISADLWTAEEVRTRMAEIQAQHDTGELSSSLANEEYRKVRAHCPHHLVNGICRDCYDASSLRFNTA